MEKFIQGPSYIKRHTDYSLFVNEYFGSFKPLNTSKFHNVILKLSLSHKEMFCVNC